MKPTLTIGNAVVYHGNNLEVLPTLPDNSVHSIVCDPPYELGFRGKKWDSSGIAYSVELWTECMRVLKPGGHLLAFSGSRTYHRMTVAIEDAGFEIRDMIAWISNKTFPKSHNIGKATAKEEWAGWGTALKPTVEPVVVARKPLIGTVAENVLTWGVGGLNIDGSRIGTEKRKNNINDFSNQHGNNFGNGEPIAKLGESEVIGRWPANIILDEYTAGLLDEQSGYLHGDGNKKDFGNGTDKDYLASSYHISYQGRANRSHGDSGGASRFFYVAKASKKDRGENNTHPTVKPTLLMEYLIKLVTPPNGTVLDPFTGSGSTGKAALLNGFKFIGIELTEEYLPIIEGRLTHASQAKEEEESETLF